MTYKNYDRDLGVVMDSQAGRRLIYDLLQCLENNPAVVDSPTATYYNLGKQEAARFLSTRLKAKHYSAYMLMMHEQFGDQETIASACIEPEDG